MNDQIDQQDEKGSAIPGVIGTIGGGSAGFALANSRISQGGTLKALRAEKEVPGSFAEGVTKARSSATEAAQMEKASDKVKKLHTDLEAGHATLGTLKDLPKAEAVDSVTFHEIEAGKYNAVIQKKAKVTTPASTFIETNGSLPDGISHGQVLKGEDARKLFQGDAPFMKLDGLPAVEQINEVHLSAGTNGKTVGKVVYDTLSEQSVSQTVAVSKLPEGIKAGEVVTGDKSKGLLEGEKAFFPAMKADIEKSVAALTRKAGGFGFGIRNAGTGGKAAIVGGAVAGAVALGFAANALLGGGSRASEVANERATTPEPAAGRA